MVHIAAIATVGVIAIVLGPCVIDASRELYEAYVTAITGRGWQSRYGLYDDAADRRKMQKRETLKQ